MESGAMMVSRVDEQVDQNCLNNISCRKIEWSNFGPKFL